MEIASLGTMVSVRKGMRKKNIYHSDHLLIVKYALGEWLLLSTSDAQNPFTIIQCYIGIQNWSRIPSPSFGHLMGLRTATTFPCPANLGGS